MGVFSWLHYLTYAKKTKLVDFHYKSLKSWKINNSDLTQQKLFKLSIFTNFYRLTAAGVNNSLQVLQGALVAGWEKKRELATTSLEFEYLHQKNWSKLLIGEDDYIVNTLGSCFHMFFHCLFTFALISASHWLKEILQLSLVGELARNLRNHNHKTTKLQHKKNTTDNEKPKRIRTAHIPFVQKTMEGAKGIFKSSRSHGRFSKRKTYGIEIYRERKPGNYPKIGQNNNSGKH